MLIPAGRLLAQLLLIGDHALSECYLGDMWIRAQHINTGPQ